MKLKPLVKKPRAVDGRQESRRTETHSLYASTDCISSRLESMAQESEPEILECFEGLRTTDHSRNAGPK